MTALILVLTLAVAGGVGVIAVPAVLRLAQRRGGPQAMSAQAILRGGLIIGILERVATAGCVLLGQPEGIAIVVAVKGLGRYPELRDRASSSQPGRQPSVTDPGEPASATPHAVGAAVSERFIIGTLTSLIWAVAIGALGRWLISVA